MSDNRTYQTVIQSSVDKAKQIIQKWSLDTTALKIIQKTPTKDKHEVDK